MNGKKRDIVSYYSDLWSLYLPYTTGLNKQVNSLHRNQLLESSDLCPFSIVTQLIRIFEILWYQAGFVVIEYQFY
jgi:hypothetical protein